MKYDNRFLVYFFETDYSRVKIGHCKGNFYDRKRHVQSGCPFPITLLGVTLFDNEEDMRRCEYDLHIKFKEFNTIGEWFILSPEISNYIKDNSISGENILKEDHRKSLDNRKRNLDRKKQYRERNKAKINEYNKEYRNRPEVRIRKSKARRKRKYGDGQLEIEY